MKNKKAVYTPTEIVFGHSVLNLESGTPIECTFLRFGLIEQVCSNGNNVSNTSITGAIIQLSDGRMLGVPLHEVQVSEETLSSKCTECEGDLYDSDKIVTGDDIKVPCRYCHFKNTFISSRKTMGPQTL